MVCVFFMDFLKVGHPRLHRNGFTRAARLQIFDKMRAHHPCPVAAVQLFGSPPVLPGVGDGRLLKQTHIFDVVDVLVFVFRFRRKNKTMGINANRILFHGVVLARLVGNGQVAQSERSFRQYSW